MVGGRLEMVPIAGSRAVIVPNESAVDFIREELDGGGFKTLTAMEAMSFNFASDDYAVAVLTYERAKGLTFDNVFLPTLSAAYWKDLSPDRRLNMLLLGITRATQWVYMSGLDGCRIEEDGILRAAAKKQLLKMEIRDYAEDACLFHGPMKGGKYSKQVRPSDGDSKADSQRQND